MMNNPSVSLIITVYNAAEYLSGLLDCVLAQSYTAFEAVLVDDGSTDGSGEICDAYARIDARFRVYHQPNSGVSASRNKGIELSKGEYLFFADSDDTLHRDYLAAGILELAKGYDLVSLNRTELYSDGTTKHFPRKRKEYHAGTPHDYLDLVLDIALTPVFSWEVWTFGIKRTLIEQYSIAFDEETDYAEDLCFALCCAAHASSAVMMPDELYVHRMREDSLSAPYKQEPAFDSMGRLSKKVYYQLCSYEDCRALINSWPMIHYAFVYKELQKVRKILARKPWMPADEFRVPKDGFFRDKIGRAHV